MKNRLLSVLLLACTVFVANTSQSTSFTGEGIRQIVVGLDNNLSTCCSVIDDNFTTVFDDFKGTWTAIMGVQSTVVSVIEDCCATLNSKIDTINIMVDVRTIESKLDTCCANIDNNFQTVFEDFRETWTQLDAICSKIEDISIAANPCAAIAISAPTTITTPGIYCIAQNFQSVSGPLIVIDASNVTLDLNGHTISQNSAAAQSGIVLNSGKVCVTIQNGTIFGNYASEAVAQQYGIEAQVANNDLKIINVTISGVWNRGISLTGAESVTIKKTKVISDFATASIACYIGQSRNVNVTDSQFSAYRDIGVYLWISSYVTLSDCAMNLNGSGLVIDQACETIRCFNCIAQNQFNNFLIEPHDDSVVDVLFSNCVASRAENGFIIRGTSPYGPVPVYNVVYENCIAQFNGVPAGATGAGFFVDNSAASRIMYRNCTANGNNNGFQRFNGSVELFNNIACNSRNANYFGISSALISSPDNARGYQNVDCSLTTPDQVAVIESKIDNLSVSSPCAPTAISGVTTITAAGSYCLANNITAAASAIITIQANDVTLDLNGHSIIQRGQPFPPAYGIWVQPGYSRITIKNGTITADNDPDPMRGTVASSAIYLEGSNSNIAIQDVAINALNSTKFWQDYGIAALGTTNLVINNVRVYDVATSSLRIQTSAKNINVKNSIFCGRGSTGIGAYIDNSSLITFDSCSFNRAATGTSVRNNAARVSFYNCQAVGDGGAGAGFDLNANGIALEFQNCSAAGYFDGFKVTENASFAMNDVLFQNCTAQRNASAGFRFNVNGTGTGATVRNCNALGNTAIGYSNQGTNAAANQFYNNVACDNGTNYVGVASALVSSPDNARGYQNVDCALTTPDQVAAIQSVLDSCCFTLNSKIDNINFNVDTSTIISKLDYISSQESSIITKLDDCCSAIDNNFQTVFEDFRETWTQLDGICSKVDTCCNTISADFQAVFEDFNQTWTQLQVIESKIDNIQVPASPCAATPITGVTTITAAGTYCLANDIESASVDPITISASCVTLDLNGHTVIANGANQGIFVTDGISNITIKNGYVYAKQSAFAGVVLQGLAFSVIKNVAIQDIAVAGEFQIGIYLNFVQNLLMNRTQVSDASFNSYNISSCSAIQCNEMVSKSVVTTSRGLSVNQTNNATFTECSFNHPATNSEVVYIGSNSSIIKLFNCMASGTNATSSKGYVVNNGASNITFAACSAQNVQYGFSFDDIIVGSTLNNISLFNCMASGNTTAGYFYNVTKAGSNGVTTTACSARGNGIGFDDSVSAVGKNEFYNNTACDNTTNYLGVTNVTSAANARGGDNIDCANNTEDDLLVLQSTLDTCCASLTSKIDILSTGILSANDGIATANMGIIDIRSQEGIIESKIDSCCETVNSQLQNLSSDFDQTWTVLDAICSKIENIVFPCAVTSVAGATTISQAGSYCLAQDISVNGSVAITINASNVTLDLNGYSIIQNGSSSGITMSANSNIVIKNGAIVAASQANYGIDAATVYDLTLQDLIVHGQFQTGIRSASVRLGVYNNIKIYDSFVQGIYLGGSQDISLSNIVFRSAQTGTRGVFIFDSQRLVFNDCIFDIFGSGDPFSFAYGVYIDYACDSLQFNYCTAMSGGTPQGAVGFNIQPSSAGTIQSLLFNHCTATNFGVGFLINDQTTSVISDVIFDSCQATNCRNVSNNGTGFSFTLNNGSSNGGIIKNCIAQGCNRGFVTNSITFDFYNNIACDNTTNYLGVTNVTSPANARGGDNIDCANTAPDAVGNVIDVSTNPATITTAAQVDAATLNLIEWMKTIYRKVSGI